MGQMSKEYLACLFILIVPWLFYESGAIPVSVTVGQNPVRSGVGWNTTISVANTSELFSLAWLDPTGSNILTRIQGLLIVKAGTPYADRVQLQPNGSLTISSTRQADEGNYTVNMEPPSGLDLTPNSIVITLEVYEPVTNVSVAVSPAEVFEGQAEVRLTCTAVTGTRVTFSWQKDSNILSNSSRVTVSGSEVRIQQLNRVDAGFYTCLVQNPISSNSNSQTLTIFYGPETPVVQRGFQSDCVVPDLVPQGRSGSLSCEAASVPAAVYTWRLDGQDRHQGSTVFFSSLSANDTGNYTCIARNTKTTNEASASTQIIAVGYCLSVGAVVGIAIGAAAALVLLILLVVFLVRRKRSQKSKSAMRKPPIKAFNKSDEKVLPWMNGSSNVKRSISPTPIYNTDQISTYSSYPPSNGSMVASTIDGGISSFSVQTDHSGRLSTLV
ncbi:carcinoembryonic antigen-related cell adhesion molecule 6-like [Heterodontus francisci]|uniref:carcinoembryonic antigen-related cell adhesion molecule 6-like n=1 Tax=Heterodontus francisci TaxID=7792 RepID=UPI00355C281D